MITNTELPTVLIKRRNIQTIFDYCLDNKIEFSVKEKPFTVEEFEVVLQIEEIKQAIAFGIFARESKIEVIGVNDKQTTQSKTSRKSSAAKKEEPKEELNEEKTETVETASTTSTPITPNSVTATETKAEEPTAEKTEDKGFSLDLSSSPSLSFS